MRATRRPTLLLGGAPGEHPAGTFASWKRAMAIPQVRGLVAGRTLLYPRDGDVARAVDQAAAIVAEKSAPTLPSPASGGGKRELPSSGGRGKRELPSPGGGGKRDLPFPGGG